MTINIQNYFLRNTFMIRECNMTENFTHSRWAGGREQDSDKIVVTKYSKSLTFARYMFLINESQSFEVPLFAHTAKKENETHS